MKKDQRTISMRYHLIYLLYYNSPHTVAYENGGTQFILNMIAISR